MSKQPRSIGVVAPDLSGYYFGAMLSGIHQIARKANMPLIVIQGWLGDQQLPIFSADQIAGWIVLHPMENDRANLAALCQATPVVTAPVPLEGVNCTLVQVDNRGGMRAAVEHLIDHGHDRIAYIDHGPQLWSQQRYQGYCDALAARAIAYDPTLVVRLEPLAFSDRRWTPHLNGEQAVRHLLERGLRCTALAASTDECALGAMQAIDAAGLCVPNDLAVVGFDDLGEAQYAHPPLTTVRCQFDAIGRAAAEQVLAEIRAGRTAQPQVISVPITVLQRRSCGCTTLDERLADVGAIHATPANWQTTLVQQLVQVVRYPLPLDPAVPPEQLWPGAGALVAALDTTLSAQPPPSASIEAAWQQAIAQTENLEVLHGALTLLEDAAEQRLAATPNATTRPAVVALLRRMRLELMRARLAYEITPKQQLGDQVRTNYAVSMALLSSPAGEAQALGWLASTPAIWGCLALWDDEHNSGAATSLRVAGAYLRDATPNLAVGRQLRATAFPPIDQLPISAQQGQDLTIVCPIRTPTRNWGVLALCGWSDQLGITGTENLTIQASLLGGALDRDTVLTTLTEQRSTLQAAFSREQMLSQTIRELGCPIIPLLPGVLLVPLIGALDSQRAQQIIGAVLEAIAEQRAQVVLLDVTGVPIVDTQVANSLIQTARAAILLGAQVVMVGIRPEIAQSIVGLGIDLQHLTIHSTLASAIGRMQLQRSSR